MVKKIVLFDTFQSSNNIGDEIIVESIKRELSFILQDSYVMSFSTHTPIMHILEHAIGANPVLRSYFSKADLKFICGTNIFKNNVLSLHSDWCINLFDIPFYKNVISVGCGSSLGQKEINIYTKHIYRKILNPNFIHSTRDNRTKALIESMGFYAINTGCPTTWCLSEEHCKDIPKKKNEKVVFTLTDYCKDIQNDLLMISILKKCYKEVYFWVQGADDIDYFNDICKDDSIKIVSPNLHVYEKLLNQDIDYVGTRLHAGIFALQKKKRSIIIAVDNRARDMDESINLRCIDRSLIPEKLEDRIMSEFNTEIKVDKDAITTWKNQFL